MTPRRDDPDRDARLHRALSSPARNRMVSVLRAAREPLDVTGLAAEVGLHPNTVRAHLVVLEDAGLVTSTPEERDRPGRPRLVYRAADGAGEPGEGGGYRFLAGVLASYLAATADDPAAAAEEAGAAWGHYLVDRPPPFHSVAPQAAVARIVELLDAFGFEPELDDREPSTPRILLRRCPFLDVARDHEAVVCSIHLGLMRGALAELGGEVEARDLLPFVEPGLCVGHLTVPT